LIISGFTAPTNWLTGVSKSNGFPDDVRFFWLYGSDDRASHNCGLSGCRFTAAPEARTDVTQIWRKRREWPGPVASVTSQDYYSSLA